MAELFIELFSEEIPSRLQINARREIKKILEGKLKKKEVGFNLSQSFSTPKRLVFLIKGININFTFLNTVSLRNMRKRLINRKKLNRYDKFNLNFYNNVQKGFVKILKKNPKRYMQVNSNLNIKHNEKIILDKIKNLI